MINPLSLTSALNGQNDDFVREQRAIMSVKKADNDKSRQYIGSRKDHPRLLVRIRLLTRIY